MADLGALSFAVHLKDYTDAEFEEIKKKLLSKRIEIEAQLGIKTNIKQAEKSIEQALQGRTYKVKVDVDQSLLSRISPTVGRNSSVEDEKESLDNLRNSREKNIKTANQHTSALQRTSSAMISQSRFANELKNQITSVYSIYSLERFIKGLYTIGGEFQKQQIALTSIIGDSTKAEAIFSRIKELAVVSPFQFKELAAYTKQLSAYGIPYEELFDTTKRLSDISAGVGVDMNRIILAYGQVRSAAFLRGQELRQFTEAGIPLVQALADGFTELNGVATSTGEVFDKISRKEVSFGMVKDILFELTDEGGKFYNMQEKLAESLAGKWSNLQDSWDIMMADIAQINSDVLGASLDMLTKLMGHWEDIAKILTTLVTTYGAYKAAVIAVTAAHKAEKIMYNITLISNLSRARAGLTTITRAQAVAQSILNKTMLNNPYVIAITAVGALAGLYIALRERTKSVTEAIHEINIEFEKQSEIISENENKAKGYISALFNEKKGIDAKTQAYQNLNKLYPKLFENMTMEQFLAKGSVDALSMVTKATREQNKQLAIGLLARTRQTRNEAQKKLDRAQENKEATLKVIKNRPISYDDAQEMIKEREEAIKKQEEELKEAQKAVDDATALLDAAVKESTRIKKEATQKWRTTATDMATEYEIEKLAPNPEESYNSYLERLAANIDDLKKNLKGLNPENAFAKETIAFYNNELEKTRKIFTTLGGVEKEKKEKDPIADQWKERVGLIDKAVKEYNKWKAIEGTDRAKSRIGGMDEFKDLFNEKFGFNLDLENPDKAYKHIQEQLDLNKAKQKALSVEIGIKVSESNISKAKKRVEEALNDMQNYIDRTSKQWDLFKSLYESTGNKEISMKFAFGGVVSFGNEAEQWKADIEKVLLENGKNDIDITGLLKMSPEKIEKQFGGELGKLLAGYVKEYQDSDTKIQAETAKNAANLIAKYKDYNKEIIEIEEKANKDIQDLEAQRSKFGDVDTDTAIKERNKRKEEEKASVGFDQLKESEEWSKVFDDLDRIGTTSLNNLIERLEAYKKSAGKNLKITEYKELINALKKLREESFDRNPFKNFGEHVKEYIRSLQEAAQAKEQYDKVFNSEVEINGEKTTIGNAFENAQNETVQKGIENVEVTIETTDAQGKATKTTTTLAKAFKKLADAEDETKEKADPLKKSFGKISDWSDVASQGFGDLASMFDSLGNEGASDVLGMLGGVASGIGDIASGIASGNPLGMISGAISGITSIVSSVAEFHDKKLDRAIKQSQLEVEKLENSYKNISNTIERQLGSATESQTKEMMSNLQKQRDEIQKQMDAESDKKDSDASKIEDYKQQIAELDDQMKYFYEDLASEQYGIDIKSWADQISGALVDAFSKGENAAEAFDKSVADIMRNVVKSIISVGVIQPAMEKLQNFLFNTDPQKGALGIAVAGSAGGTDITAEEAGSLGKELLSTKDEIVRSKELWDVINKALEEAGVSLSELDSSSLSKGIQSITEDTANLLASYLNAMRADISAKRLLLEKLINDLMPQYSIMAEAQLTQLNMIAANTRINADAAVAIRDTLNSIITIGNNGKAIKTLID